MQGILRSAGKQAQLQAHQRRACRSLALAGQGGSQHSARRSAQHSARRSAQPSAQLAQALPSTPGPDPLLEVRRHVKTCMLLSLICVPTVHLLAVLEYRLPKAGAQLGISDTACSDSQV